MEDNELMEMLRRTIRRDQSPEHQAEVTEAILHRARTGAWWETRPMKVADELWAVLDPVGLLLTDVPPEDWDGRAPIDLNDAVYIGYDEVADLRQFLEQLL